MMSVLDYNADNYNSNINDHKTIYDPSLVVQSRFLSQNVNNTNHTSSTVAANTSLIVRRTLRVYGSLFLACLILFLLLRYLFPRLYNLRSWVRTLRSPLAQRSYPSWCGMALLWQVFDVSDHDLLRHCGMDALCFIRALHCGRKLALLACFNALWLIPLYRTVDSSHQAETDPFVLISVANLPKSSRRFLGTILASYVTFGYVMYLILQEYKWFTRQRHIYLAQKEPRNYAVYVSGIPPPYRSSYALRQFFVDQYPHPYHHHHEHGGGSSNNAMVLEAHVAMDTPQLDVKVARREVLLQKLEHTAALERITGSTATQWSWHWHSSSSTENGSSSSSGGRCRRGGWFERIESVRLLQEELVQLNRDIARTIRAVMAKHDPLRCHFTRLRATNAFRYNAHDEQEDEEEGYDPTSRSTVTTVVAASYGGGCSDSNLTRTSGEDGLLCPMEDQSSEQPDIPAQVVQLDEIVAMAEENVSFPTRSELELSNPVYDLDEDQSGQDKIQDEQQAREPQWPRGERPMIQHSASMGNEAIKHQHHHNNHRRPDSAPASPAAEYLRSSLVMGTKAFSDASGILGLTLATAGSKGLQTAKEVGTKGLQTAKQVGGHVIKTAGTHGAKGMKKAHKVGSDLVTSAGAVLPILLTKSEGEPREGGFVVFRDLFATQAALQMVQHPSPYAMEVHPAPDPHDVFWRNVGMPARARRTGQWAAMGSTAVLCFFYSFPIAFISSLNNVSTLKQVLPAVGHLIDEYPQLETVFALIAPLLLLIINEIFLPTVLRYFASWEGHVSSSMLDFSLFIKLGWFQIIQTFFVSAVSGSITAELKNILNDPQSIINLLANSLPARSSFFIQVLLTQTFMLTSIELLRIRPLSMALIRRFIGPNLTTRERRRKWGILFSLEEPPPFGLAETFAQLILYYIVLLVYSTIAPVVAFFSAFCFVISEGGYRYQFVHNYPPDRDTGGQLFQGFLQFLQASMIIAQLTLIGLMALKQSVYAGPALGPLLAVSIMFIMFINSRHSHVPMYLPTSLCAAGYEDAPRGHDNNNSGAFHIPPAAEDPMIFVKGEYLQPSMQHLSLEPNYNDSDDDEDNDVDDAWGWTSRRRRRRRRQQQDPIYEKETPV